MIQQLSYTAKNAYRDEHGIRAYEENRFSGILGKYRFHREQDAVRTLISQLPGGLTIADCPSGTGRWWPVLAHKANHIIGLDISEPMRVFARTRAANQAVNISVIGADAEHLPLKDESVDYVFSHALTKHLPIPIQYRVLREFARISRKGVICSFGIFSHLSYEVWKRRSLAESFPVINEELEWMARAAGLKIERRKKCTTPVGVEHTVLFTKKSTADPSGVPKP